MKNCRAAKVISGMLPVRAWKGTILGRHIEQCPSCQASLAGYEEAQSYVPRPEGSGGQDPVWPAVEARIRTMSEAPVRSAYRSGRRWKPLMGLAALAAALVLIFVVTRPTRPADEARSIVSLEDFRLDSVEAWGRPARALVYQAGDPRTTIIWVR